MKSKPVLAITMGDPAGIGPEISIKAFTTRGLYKECRPLLIGNADVLEKVKSVLGIDFFVNVISDVSDAVFEYGTIDLYNISCDKVDEIEFGKVSAYAGDVAFRSVVTAIDLAMKEKVDGTVTGPINKESINKAGYHYSGHTEIYAHYTGTKKFCMLLADEKLKITHVTTHVSLREACDLVKKDRILDVIKLTSDGLKSLGIKNPKVGVAGLNPHAGDGGLFGKEEIEEIAPAVKEAKKLGYNAEGPFPPDTLFSLGAGGNFDGCVAMYHDQGHIPFKMVGFVWDEEKKAMKSVRGVNITLGLPIIRTSVDHGTAFEIAGKGIASEDALLFAVDYAIKLYENR